MSIGDTLAEAVTITGEGCVEGLVEEGFLGGSVLEGDTETGSFSFIENTSVDSRASTVAWGVSSYLSNYTMSVFTASNGQLTFSGSLPIISNNYYVTIDTSLVNTFQDYITLVSPLLQGPGGKIGVYSNGTTVISNKPNTKILLTFVTQPNSKINTPKTNLFVSMYWSFLILNPDKTEEDALTLIENITGISNTVYDYFQNDFYYNYTMQNPAKFTLDMYPPGISTMDYPLLCIRMSSQICFLWDIIYYYAMLQGLAVDANFALVFYQLIYTNMNGTQVILTKALINDTFPDLIPHDVDLDPTIIYWVGLINAETNIVNLLILKHVCDFLNILETGISPLLENNVALLSQSPYNVSYATISQILTDIYNYIGPIFLNSGIYNNVSSQFLNPITFRTKTQPPPPPEPTPINDICFPASTPVVTDRGIVPIEKIKPAFHTIDSKKILAITKTISTDKYLVCFEKDSLGKNYPSDKTIVSKQHKISYKGKLIEACIFLGIFENVYKTPYNGEVLYNILLEDHGKITVNNMICETLHPNNAIAKLYTSPMPSSIKNKMIVLMNELVTKKESKMYKKVLQYF